MPGRALRALVCAVVWRVAGGANTVVVTGGGEGGGDFCEWTRYAPDEESPGARYGHTLVASPKTTRSPAKMILFGGFDGAFSNNYMNDMWLWDVSPYQAEAAGSGGTASPSSSSSDGTGGSATSIGDQYDAGKWRVVKQTGTIPRGRYGHVAAVVQDTSAMIMFGGNSGHKDLLSDLWVFSITRQLWREYQPAPHSASSQPVNHSWPAGRSYATATDVEGVVYMFGGWSSSGGGAIAELWKLELGSTDTSFQAAPPGNGSSGGGEEGLSVSGGPKWTLLLDSCGAGEVRSAVPERCAATDEAACQAVEDRFSVCGRWNEPAVASFPDGLSGKAMCDDGGAGSPPACDVFHPNVSQPAAGCVGHPAVCARAGECAYTAPNRTASLCGCTGLVQCTTLHARLHATWGKTAAQVPSGCLMLSGPDRSADLFNEADKDNSGLIDKGEIADSIILQYDRGGAGSSGQIRDNKLSRSEFINPSSVPRAHCVADHAARCAAAVNDGTAATCERAGHCTYHPAQRARSCNPGPSARFGHAAVKVSIDLMIFGGHTGSAYLKDLWRYDTTTKLWSQISSVSGSEPLSRAYPIAVAMNGGMLLWGGYTSDCDNSGGSCSGSDQPEQLLDDVWLFANPAGTAIETRTATVKTLTQVWTTTVRELKVENAQPEWTELSAYSNGETGGVAVEDPSFDTSTTPGMPDFLGTPAARRASRAVALDAIQGLALFGGESADGLLADTWVLQCGGLSKMWILWVVLGSLALVLLAVLCARWYLRHRRQRATLKRVTALLSSIGSGGGGLNRNGIMAEKIAPLGRKPPEGFFVESGRLTPPRLLEYDAKHLQLSKGFNASAKAPPKSAKQRWGALSSRFKGINAFSGSSGKAQQATPS
jgi:hypothetical protein